MDIHSLPSTPLYHYTDAQGLKGIFDSQTLWATNIYYLNDSQEYDYALMVANRVIYQRADAVSDQREKEVLRSLGQPEGINLERQPRGLAPQVFVTSFSVEGDLLSQWRSYCPNGAGYSIGFVASDLYWGASIQGFGLAPCLYDEPQCKAVERVLDELMKSASWIRALENPGQEDSRRAVIVEWHDRLGLLAPTIKHPSFREEREWRLISTAIPWGDPRCLVRVGRSMLIPYVKINLVEISPQIPVKEIIVGPTPHMWLAMQAAGSLLHARHPSGNFGQGAIGRSKIPYRNW